jgi:hypothetical protein
MQVSAAKSLRFTNQRKVIKMSDLLTGIKVLPSALQRLNFGKHRAALIDYELERICTVAEEKCIRILANRSDFPCVGDGPLVAHGSSCYSLTKLGSMMLGLSEGTLERLSLAVVNRYPFYLSDQGNQFLAKHWMRVPRKEKWYIVNAMAAEFLDEGNGVTEEEWQFWWMSMTDREQENVLRDAEGRRLIHVATDDTFVLTH